MTTTTNTNLIDLLEERLAEYLLDADEIRRIPVSELLNDADLEGFDASIHDRLDVWEIETDVETVCLYPGNRTDQAEYGGRGTWALFGVGGHECYATGSVLPEGEWSGDPFYFLRGA